MKLLVVFCLYLLAFLGGDPEKEKKTSLPKIESECDAELVSNVKTDLIFPILYIGKPEENIKANCPYSELESNRKVTKEEFVGEFWIAEHTKLILDTTQTFIAPTSQYRSKNGETAYRMYNVRCIPVWFINNSPKRNDIIGAHLPIHLEYLDSNNVWQKALNRDIFMCGTFDYNIRLEAGEIILTSLAINPEGESYLIRLSDGYGPDAIHSNVISAKVRFDK